MALLRINQLKKGLPIAIRKKEINKSAFFDFIANLKELLNRKYKTESESTISAYISEFLKNQYHVEANIGDDKGGGIDLAILNNSNNNVAVIIEIKKFDNQSEMPSSKDGNRKALHEAIRYYMFQRLNKRNLEVKRIVITNYEEWYFFDASDFYSLFYKNPSFKESYLKWKAGRLDGRGVEVFYNDIAKSYLSSYEKNNKSLPCIHFSLNKYDFIKSKNVEEFNSSQLRELEDLFHFFSPDFLLKEFQESDANILNESFYKELLYILGLKEDPKSKKIKRSNSSDTASIIGNTLNSFHQKLIDFPDGYLFGEKLEERNFNISLELCITWLNRIIFLKLLEAQLIWYHNGDEKYSFLNYQNNFTFRDINILFFQVLALKIKDRNIDFKEKYKEIPYLNSTLFSPTDLESKIGEIKDLNPDKEVLIYSKTVLKI